MAMSWDEICVLEVNLKYPDVIDAIEELLKDNPNDKEAVIRLGFHYWFAVIENDALGLNVPWEEYTTRFRELLNTYKDIFANDADFCFSYGLGLNLCYFYFVPDSSNTKSFKAYESLGKKLLKKAASLDPFYKKFNKAKATQEEIAEHFSGRGCFLRYYNVV
ncbi:MAG: hypothetical protein ACYS18_04575 [Planctomycetota bacterium]